MDIARLKRAIVRSINAKPIQVSILEAEKNEFKGFNKNYVTIDNFKGTIVVKKATSYTMDDQGKRIVKKPNIYIVALVDPATNKVDVDNILDVAGVKYEVVAVDDVDELGVYYNFLVRRL